MEQMDALFAYAKANPSKMALIKRHADTPQDMMALLTYIKFPEQDLETICKFRDNDWMMFGTLREFEYYANRKIEDIPAGAKGEKDVLSEEYFNKINKNNKKITYALYVQMRNAHE
jgi:hypothetical protein